MRGPSCWASCSRVEVRLRDMVAEARPELDSRIVERADEVIDRAFGLDLADDLRDLSCFSFWDRDGDFHSATMRHHEIHCSLLSQDGHQSFSHLLSPTLFLHTHAPPECAITFLSYYGGKSISSRGY